MKKAVFLKSWLCVFMAFCRNLKVGFDGVMHVAAKAVRGVFASHHHFVASGDGCKISSVNYTKRIWRSWPWGLQQPHHHSTSVPAVRCYSATRPAHKTLSGVSASIRQPFIGSSLFIILTIIAITLQAQVQSIGRIITYKKLPNGIEGKTANGFFKIQPYNDHTVRVRISKKNAFTDFSYALTNPQPPLFSAAVSDEGNRLRLTTKALHVVVEKTPLLRVIFQTTTGQVINEDVPGEGFGTSFLGDRVSSYKTLHEGERFVGLGEVLGPLDKRGTGYTLNNTDTYKYGDPRLSMYSSIPFYIGLHHGLVYGLFYHNSHKSFFNFGLSTPFTSITAEGGDVDYFLIHDSSVAKVLEHYTALTGRMPLPPLWSLGYHQSRASYYPQQRVEWVAQTFRSKEIPIDCMVLDAEYQLGYQPFLVNRERFPDLPGLAASLRKLNVELTASVYPGVKIDSAYASYTSGLKQDVFLKYSNGKLFETDIAPVHLVLPDYTSPKARAWWAERMQWMEKNGIRGYWNDMNEPAVGGSYLPDNLVFDFDGRKASSLEGKNLYGFQMARSSYEAALQNNKNKRPFVLARSGFAGVQRYSALWSGDNTTSDEGLLSGVLLNNQLGLSGLPFVGPDLGGYIGDGTKNLFKRWMQIGVFSPYVRNHKEAFATANEPWAYGEEAEAISKSYIGFRYRLMPYVYSKFYEASQTGMPIARSLCITDPFDDKVYDALYQYQFLFGDAVMVVPVTSMETQKKIYLPKGEWYDLATEEKHSGEKEVQQAVPIYRIPLFVKASAIIPMESLVQSTKDKPSDTLFLHLYKGNAANEFVYYEDAGDGFDYLKDGFCKRVMQYNSAEKTLRLLKQEGSYTSQFKKIEVVFHGFGDEVNAVRVNGVAQSASTVAIKLLDGLEHLKIHYDKGYLKSLREAEPVLRQKAVVVENNVEEVVLKW